MDANETAYCITCERTRETFMADDFEIYCTACGCTILDEDEDDLIED